MQETGVSVARASDIGTISPDAAARLLQDLASHAGSLAASALTGCGTSRSSGTASVAVDSSVYKTLIEQIPGIVFLAYLDRPGSEAFVSPGIETALGYTREEWLEDPIRWYRSVHPDDRTRWSAEAAELLANGKPIQSVYRVFARDGRIRHFQCSVGISRGDAERPSFLHGIAFDISDRLVAESRFRELLESAPDAMVIVRQDGTIVLVNSQTEVMFGYTRGELLGNPVELLIPERARGRHAGHRSRYFPSPKPRPMGAGFELNGRRKDGSEFPVEISLSPLETADGMLVSSAIRDVTVRRQTELKMLQSLREKEALLQEIHHRVKNNLGVIQSLLYLQSLTTSDPRFVEMLGDCQDRVRSMALVHESLYRSGNLADVDFGDYAEELSRRLMQAYVAPADRLRLHCDLSPVALPIAVAVPCGLILNEMVTNAIKHGFAGGRAGTITVTVRPTDGGFLIQVCDDGHGLPDDFDLEAQSSLGLRLIRTLARQVDGEFSLTSLAPGVQARLQLGPAR
jgi:PAS domain S-box-containing protein